MSDVLFHPSSLPIANKLHDLLRSKLSDQLLTDDKTLATSSFLVFNFRDSTYRPEQGGFHPVEIAIVQSANGRWNIEYITDFAYVGSHYPELERCLDFDFRDQAFFAQYTGWKPIKSSTAARELYQLWEGNFLSYIDMDAYDDITLKPQ
ncbi:DUF2787 domain-containing protein [Vibrio sp. 03-59-1]|uniref:DUF2787 domain-containing protein n=1 Tax=Vibrio sp. 03-59-1 TaxID=2607607 RepID=UPI00149390C5|nr:DUF2787 domain-containing protein [Vibrio sp. 03-59-1]NOH84673.1 DUF2787 domain-containing protein [Vibrio sp. 03-59-1]